MLISYKRGQGSIVLRVKILNSSVSTGAGLTGLSSASAGLIIAAIADNEATTVAYTQAGSTIESITTLGTYAAPTATKCRFKEVDSTNHKGIYEIQLADTRFAGGKSMIVSISGATNLAETDVCVPLTDLDPYDSVRLGATALPNAAAAAANGLWILGINNTAAITIGNLTMGALAASTVTFSGAVAFQSTFTVTGAVAFNSTFATTGATTFNSFTITNNLLVSGNMTVTGTTTHTGAVSFGSTFAVTGTVTYNAFTVTNALTVSGATTLTGAVTASNASNNIVGVDVAKISGDSTAADNAESFFDGTGYAGTNNVIPLVTVVTAVTGLTASDVGAIKTKTDNLPSDPADASDIASAFGTVNTTLATIASYLDTEIAAIKAKTDQLTFTVALSVDATAIVSAASIRSAIGMATNDLDTQLDAILAASGGGATGSGSSTYTVTVDDGTNPLDGAEVWVSTDLAGTSISAGTLHTDAFGVATFLLDPGDYYLWVQHSRYNGTNPTAFTVT